MNPRIVKEARLMFWPWAVITGAAALMVGMPWDWQPPWMLPHLAEATVALIAFIGFPLLAGLPVGYEFQYQTLPILLASPVDRGRIWREKFLATLALVLLPAILCALRARENDLGLGFAALAAAWLAALTAAAMYWTLLAKSTLGGLALNVCVQWLLFAGWLFVESELRAYGHFSAGVEAAGVVLLLADVATMVWLGRRALVRFQAVEGSLAADPLAELSARLVPRGLADWFRCRPRGLVLNLVRRELRLLRPVWPLAALNVLAWTCPFALGTDPGYHPGVRNPEGVLIVAALVGAVALGPLIAILAGTLSLGEEKTYGTHSWHMTLPASARLQWFAKLSIAALASALFAGTLPPLAFVARGWMTAGMPFRLIAPRAMWMWPLVFSSLTVVAFWISAVTRGTVRAALWVFPAIFAFGAAGNLGFWSGQKFMGWAQGLSGRILLLLDPFRIAKIALSQAWGFPLAEVAMALAVGPVAAFILVESYRMFRGQAADTNRHLVQNLLKAALVFLCGMALGDAAGLALRSMEQERTLFRETDAAIRKIEAGTPIEAGAQPVRLTAAELAQAAPLSESTRHWLGAAAITLGRINVRNPRRCCSVFDLVREPGERSHLEYTAVLSLTNGSKCTMAYRRFPNGFAVVGGRCP